MAFMSASLMLIFAAYVQKSGASRFSHSNGNAFNPFTQPLGLHAAHGLAPRGSLVHGPVTHGPWRVPPLNMQMDPEVPNFDFKPDRQDNWRDIPGVVVQEPNGSVTFSNSFYPGVYPQVMRREQLVDARFPPEKLANTDMRYLLRTWLLQQKQNSYEIALRQLPRSSNGTPEANWTESASVLTKIWYDLEKTRGLETVGLMPSVLSESYLPQVPDDSVMAIAAFSREKLKTDPMGSLLKMVEAQFGIEATRNILRRRRKRVSVFMIKGLARGPGSSEDSARILLAKIAEWAEAEKRLVVVARDSLNDGSPIGRDLTEYYKRLGFERVMGDDGTYDLVFRRTWVDLLSTNTDLLSKSGTLVGLKFESLLGW